MQNITPNERVIVALDFASVATAEALVEKMGDTISFYKVGLELIYAGGLPLVKRLKDEGKQIFLDAKLLDIDNTIAGAVGSITTLGVDLVTVHAYPKAMRAAVAARGDAPTRLLGVTVLTSMDDADLADAGYGATASDLVMRRALDAREAGMDGVICAPAEATAIRAATGPDFLIVTPGVRTLESAIGDQKRVATPAEAIAAGADRLVVGRAITAAGDPVAAARAVVEEVAAAGDATNAA